MGTVETAKGEETAAGESGKRDALTIKDERTGRVYEVPIVHGTVRATDLRQIKTGPEDFGLMTYDPAFLNTASCTSRITFIDGDKGILRYRGYPIEVLAEKCNVPGGGLPPPLRRAAQPEAVRGLVSTTSPTTP